MAAVDALLITTGLYPVEGSPLFAISRLGTLVGMLLVGIAAVVARRWEGWRRFSPFAVLLALPISIVFAMATGIGSIVIFIGLAWAIISYAILSTPTR